jgi:crotonobetaine/carnitine-CoA ligase
VQAPAWHAHVGRDLCWLLDTQAATHADKAFLVWEPGDASAAVSWTYRQFREDALAAAAKLRAMQVSEGDRVMIHMDNAPELLLYLFGCAYVGAVSVLTNTRAAGPELLYFAEHSNAVGVLTQAAHHPLVASINTAPRWIEVPDRRAPKAAAGSADVPRRRAASDSPLSIQYTSGTTSRPKGVVWTHANALFGAMTNARHEGLTDRDVHLVFLPLFHTNALSYSILATLWAGAAAVLMPKFSASRFWDVAVRNRCTWASMVPFCRKALLSLPTPQHHFRLWGTAVCSPPDDAYFGVKTIGWWGMTETISHGIVGDLDHANLPLSIGRAAPEYGLRVVDDEDNLVAPGGSGRLQIKGVRGVSLFLEYLNDPEATREAFTEDGWFKTGDRVHTTADGYLIFADREKDMLKVGGENVAASEVERVINSVAGVREAAVIGVPHDMLGETPIAFVIAEHPTEALRQSIERKCRQDLSDFKAPRAIHFVDELPRVTLNKVSKAALREHAARLNPDT